MVMGRTGKRFDICLSHGTEYSFRGKAPGDPILSPVQPFPWKCFGGKLGKYPIGVVTGAFHLEVYKKN
jgi:hypothetical protein